MIDWQPCGYGCGKPWRPFAGTKLRGHARCAATPEQQDAILARLEATSMTATVTQAAIAAEYHVSTAVLRAWLADAMKRRRQRNAPAGMPASDRFEHGTRARYIADRCRCHACRKANCEYAKTRYHAQRAGDWNGLTSAAPIRAHLALLSAAGVGYKQAADAASIARSVVAKIATGQKRMCREHTARALLAIDAGAAAGGARIDGASTWVAIRWLLEQGLTRGEISQRIGNVVPALQLKKRVVLASTALRIAKLRREVEEELRASAEVAEICPDCGYSHAPKDRQAIVARMAGAESAAIAEAWPCFYPPSDSGYRLLMRDLAAVRGSGRRAA